jgi:hypothetical protein
MKMKVDALEKFNLDLAYLAANGYSGFDFFDQVNCWRAERSKQEQRITEVKLIVNDMFSPHLTSSKYDMFVFRLNEQLIIPKMRSENIGLQWVGDKECKLYFQAFPEIYAIDKDVSIAFKKLMVKKEFGDTLDDKIVEDMNLDRHKKMKGMPL